MRSNILFVAFVLLVSIAGVALVRFYAGVPGGFSVLRASAEPIRAFPVERVMVVSPPDESGLGVYESPSGRRFIGKPSADGAAVAVRRWVMRYARPSGSTQYIKSVSDS